MNPRGVKQRTPSDAAVIELFPQSRLGSVLPPGCFGFAKAEMDDSTLSGERWQEALNVRRS
jgi:hypothetical protein